jgi:hypothetical protein
VSLVFTGLAVFLLGLKLVGDFNPALTPARGGFRFAQLWAMNFGVLICVE